MLAARGEHKCFRQLEQFSSPSVLGSAPRSLGLSFYLGQGTSTSESGPSLGSHRGLVAGPLGPRWTLLMAGTQEPLTLGIPSSLRAPSGQESEEAGGAAFSLITGWERMGQRWWKNGDLSHRIQEVTWALR